MINAYKHIQQYYLNAFIILNRYETIDETQLN